MHQTILNIAFASMVVALVAGCHNDAAAPHYAAPHYVATGNSTAGPSKASSAGTKAKAKVPEAPKSFQQETLYTLLSAELAGQRGDLQAALSAYQKQIKTTRDPKVAQRGYQIANYMGEDTTALDMAILWANYDPKDAPAQQAAAVELARANRFDESMHYMERALKNGGEVNFELFAIAAQDVDTKTRQGLTQSYQRLHRIYPDNLQISMGLAALYIQMNEPQKALDDLDALPKAKTSNNIDVLNLKIMALEKLGRAEDALDPVEEAIKEKPDDFQLQLNYVRLLLKTDHTKRAHKAFESLMAKSPDSPEVRLSIAALAMESQQWPIAIKQMQALIAANQYTDFAHFGLGEIYDEKNEPQKALNQLRLVRPGKEYLAAQGRIASIMVKQKDITGMQAYMKQQRQLQPELALALYLMEAEALTLGGEPHMAWKIIAQASNKYPDDHSVLYTRAMIEEKLGKTDDMVRDLKRLIALDPSNAMALNALGYWLANNNRNLPEARAYLEKAHRLMPDDPAILDSLGWLYYREGDYPKAVRYLKKAYERFPDQEVSAHLGEVLWKSNKKEEAMSIWREAIQKDPHAPDVRQALKRFTGKSTI